MGGITRAGKLYTMVQSRALTSIDSVAFLNHLRREIDRKLLVIWDGSPIHRSAVTTFMSKGGAQSIHLEPLPPYAPDLNPGEGVWQQWKHVEMRNLSCLNLTHLRIELNLAIMRLRNKPRLVQSFFAGAKLPLKT
jgi:transposase